MSEMTTQEMLLALTRQNGTERMYGFVSLTKEDADAIAARLKALEEMRGRVRILAEAGLAWQLQERPAADELRAILDTVLENDDG